MADYRRNYVPGGTYFFTVVTASRRPILTTDLGRECLREAIDEIKAKSPFTLFAMVHRDVISAEGRQLTDDCWWVSMTRPTLRVIDHWASIVW